MQEINQKISLLLTTSAAAIRQLPEETLNQKPAPERWSKKEILGHLIDSALYNIQRFTEICFAEKPFRVQPYQQDVLVKANGYQQAEKEALLALWLSLNQHILHLMQQQTEETLAYPLVLPDGTTADLNFLMDDYVSHLAHHLRQILN